MSFQSSDPNCSLDLHVCLIEYACGYYKHEMFLIFPEHLHHKAGERINELLHLTFI